MPKDDSSREPGQKSETKGQQERHGDRVIGAKVGLLSSEDEGKQCMKRPVTARRNQEHQRRVGWGRKNKRGFSKRIKGKNKRKTTGGRINYTEKIRSTRSRARQKKANIPTSYGLGVSLGQGQKL